jgi:hypothetical protein
MCVRGWWLPVKYETRIVIARLLFTLSERSLRATFCACRRQHEPFVEAQLQAMMDAVEREMAGESTED